MKRRAGACTVVVWTALTGWAHAQAPTTLPATALAPPNIMLPNYNSVAVGETASLEANASLVRASDTSAAWYNPAGLSLVQQSSVAGSAGTFQIGRVRPEEAASSGGSFQQIPSTVGFVAKSLFGREALAGGFSIARVNAWSQSLDLQRQVTLASGTERVVYSGLSELSGWVADAGVGYRLSDRFRLGATFDFQHTTIHRDAMVADQYLTGAALATGVIESRADASFIHLRATVGAQYDLTPSIRIGALMRTPGWTVASSGSIVHEGSASNGTSTTTASLFDTSADVRYRVPFEFRIGAGVIGARAQIEANVMTWAGGNPYDVFRTDQTWIITSNPGGGAAPTVQARSPLSPVVDAQTVVNVAVGGRVAITRGGSWMLHGGYATDRSPVGPQDTFFSKADLQAVTVGISGRAKFLLGSFGLRYETGTSAPMTLRPLQSGEAVTTRLKLSTFGFVYSFALLF